MTAEEFSIRKVAQELIHLYAALEGRKHSPEKPPEVRTMQNTGGKPSMPGNWLWMARGIENEQKLREVALNAFGDLKIKLKDDDGVIHNLLAKIAFNAQAISELPWAEDFHQELDDQARQMGTWLNPPDAGPVANADPYLTADSIQRSLTNKGLDADPATIRQGASRGHVDMKTRRDGKRAYRLKDIIRRLKGDDSADHDNHDPE